MSIGWAYWMTLVGLLKAYPFRENGLEECRAQFLDLISPPPPILAGIQHTHVFYVYFIICNLHVYYVYIFLFR